MNQYDLKEFCELKEQEDQPLTNAFTFVYFDLCMPKEHIEITAFTVEGSDEPSKCLCL